MGDKKKNKIPGSKHHSKAERFYKDYKALGTLEKVAKNHKVSIESVRQILLSGSRAGFFSYPVSPTPKKSFSLTAEQFTKDYIRCGTLEKLAQYYAISVRRLKCLMREYNLTIEKLHSDLQAHKALHEYRLLARKIGHHPTVTELQGTTRGKSLHNRILSLHGTIRNFRRKYRIANVNKKPPKFLEKKKETSKLINRNILLCLNKNEYLKVSDIAGLIGLSKETVRVHLLKLKEEGTVGSRTNGSYEYYLRPKATVYAADLKERPPYPSHNIDPKDCAFIYRFCSLYMKTGNLRKAAKCFGKKKAALLNETDRIIKTGAILPIKTRTALLLSLRIKIYYDRTLNIKKVAKIFALSPTAVANYLNYGKSAGLFQYPAPRKVRKTGIDKKSIIEDRYSYTQIQEMRKIKKEYDKFGSLREVAEDSNLSYESVRKLLVSGDEFGLFEFPIKKKELKDRISKERLRAALIRENSASRVAIRYRTSTGQVKAAIKAHSLSMARIKDEAGKIKIYKSYQRLVKKMGYHPATPEIKQREEYLLRRINKLWGSIYKFRMQYGIAFTRKSRKREIKI